MRYSTPLRGSVGMPDAVGGGTKFLYLADLYLADLYLADLYLAELCFTVSTIKSNISSVASFGSKSPVMSAVPSGFNPQVQL